jgi:predicted aspartyl protease
MYGVKQRAIALCIVAFFAFVTSARAEVSLTRSSDGHDTVPVFVNGQGPYPFILDTGADGTAVYQWFAKAARLKPASDGKESLSGQTGTAQVAMYSVDEFELDNREVRHLDAVAIPNRHDAGNEAGVLGTDFMDGAVVAFDFPCRHVDVYSKRSGMAKAAVANAAPVTAERVKGTGLLAIPVTVNGHRGIAVIDTGSRNSRLTSAFARAAGVNASSSAFHDAPAIYGANSRAMTPRVGPIGAIGIAGLSVTNATAEVVDLPVLHEYFGDKPAMLLGADILGRFRFIYDHAANKVWFLPSSCAVR